jgi:hypothetical protein
VKVTITTGDRAVEIESTEDGMSVHRLANIAVNTWRRTAPPLGESCGPAYGFNSQVSATSPFRMSGSGHRWLDEGRPLDAS